LTDLANDDIRLKDQRLRQYPPVYLKVGPKILWIPVGHYFEERKESIAVSRLAISLAEIIDPNLYFFSNHPRERVGIHEFEKFPYILLPFMLLGIFETVSLRKGRVVLFGLLVAIFSISLLGNKNPLGPFAIFPFIVATGAFGLQSFFRKIRRQNLMRFAVAASLVLFVLILVQMVSYA
jgi:hypothetical protein